MAADFASVFEPGLNLTFETSRSAVDCGGFIIEEQRLITETGFEVPVLS
jgi:Xaa-Pro aminopeptidase